MEAGLRGLQGRRGYSFHAGSQCGTARRWAVMNLKERSDLLLTFARVLYVNGQSTDETLAAAERLGNKLDLRTRIIPRWGELQLQVEEGGSRLLSLEAADPTGVDMDRVASAMGAIEEVGAGRLALPAAREAIIAI